MTSRYAAFTVILSENVREDDAEEIMTALRMVKGVLDIRPILAEAIDGQPHIAIAEARVDYEWRRKIADLINP